MLLQKVSTEIILRRMTWFTVPVSLVEDNDQYYVIFVKDNATMSLRYFENHVPYFVQNRRK